MITLHTGIILLSFFCLSLVVGVILLLLQRFRQARAQELSRKSEERSLRALESSTDGLWDWNVVSNAVVYSDDLLETLGLGPMSTPDGIEAFCDRMHPEDLESTWDALERHLQQGTPFQVEYRMQTQSGDYLWFLSRGQALWDEAGKAVRMTGWVQDISERKQTEVNLQTALSEINRLKDLLEAERAYLQEEIKLEYNYENIIGQSDAIQYVFYKVEQIAATDTTVLVLGETGTGKELVARAIHSQSHRKDRALLKVNCATLPANLIESELFGHEKGAFTGAHARQLGRFEVVNGATLFLDEIGELPLELQAKLLRVIQDGEFERLGSSQTIKADVRVIAATNRHLDEEVRAGRFREDLWYRLNIFPITVPPLRDRRDDIPLLVDSFTMTISKRLGKSIANIPTTVMTKLHDYHWPGNVRELENVLERAIINSSGPKLHLVDELKTASQDVPMAHKTLREIEREYILKVLEQTGWKVSGKNGAAEVLGLDRSTLRARMNKLGIFRP